MSQKLWEDPSCLKWVEEIIHNGSDDQFVEHAEIVDKLLEIEESARFIVSVASAVNKPLRWVSENVVFAFSRELANRPELSERIKRKRLPTGWAYRSNKHMKQRRED